MFVVDYIRIMHLLFDQYHKLLHITSAQAKYFMLTQIFREILLAIKQTCLYQASDHSDFSCCNQNVVACCSERQA